MGRLLTAEDLRKAKEEFFESVVEDERYRVTKEYYTNSGGCPVISIRREKCEYDPSYIGGHWTSFSNVCSTYTPDGRLIKRTVRGLSGSRSVVVYDPPGRFFGKGVN